MSSHNGPWGEHTLGYNALRGFALQRGSTVTLHHSPVFVVANEQNPQRKVALISGGGAGHEPLHAAFVGRGGLDAACPGEVFTSPNNSQIYGAGLAVQQQEGCLLIIKNYTGDVINFRIAGERLRADGIAVADVVVADDIGTFLGGEDKPVGRRGTAATVLVEKILAGAADDGQGLEQLKALGDQVGSKCRSLSVAFRAHSSIETGKEAFESEAGSVEYGVGIHGEKAARRQSFDSVPTLVEQMLDDLTASDVDASAPVDVLVNGLGGYSNIALLAVQNFVAESLRKRGVEVTSAVSGTFISALDMQGFSITLAQLSADERDLWLRQATEVSFPNPELNVGTENHQNGQDDAAAAHNYSADSLVGLLAATFDERRDFLNELDQRAGDGDIGHNLELGFRLARATDEQESDAAAQLDHIAEVFLTDVGGSSGPLFGMAFKALAQSLENDADSWPAGFASAVDRVGDVAGSKPGDRTFLDAFGGAASAADLSSAVAAAFSGAQATKNMLARFGRGSYLGDRLLGSADPGAVAAAIFVTTAAEWVDGHGIDQVRARIDSLLQENEIS